MTPDTYTAIRQVECNVCATDPVVGLRTPGGEVVSTGLCGPHFFGDRMMCDPEMWNNGKEATE